MTIRLDGDIKERLAQLAEKTQRSNSYLVADAIRDSVETNEWQLKELRAALEEADAGDFASEDEVNGLAKRWKVDGR